MTKLRILLVDVDRPLLECYSDELVRAGFDVAMANDGLECVDQLKVFEPDLLVLEPRIPWGQGDGVVAYMCEEADVPLVPVVVLTSGTDLLENYQLPKFPVLERHQKPLAAAALVQTITRLAHVTAER